MNILEQSSRTKTLREAISYAYKLNSAPVIVEIGTTRSIADNYISGDGHATWIFGWEVVTRHSGRVHTVDIDAEAIAVCQQATLEWMHWIRYWLEDGRKFLQDFDQHIDLLYLDGPYAESGDKTHPAAIDGKHFHLQCVKELSKRGKYPSLILVDDVFSEDDLGKAEYLDDHFKQQISRYQRVWLKERQLLYVRKDLAHKLNI